MNPEVEKLIKEMESGRGGNASNQFPTITKVLAILADDMDKQTRRIIRLTWALVLVSVALLVFGIVQTAIMLKQDASAHAQQVEAGQNQKGAGTNQ